MIVDDEPDIRYLLRTTLEDAGYGVVEAAHGEAALEQVRRSRPQLVVTDWMMPRMIILCVCVKYIRMPLM